MPENTFSDLPQYGAATPRSLTIVLLDNLNTLSGNGHEEYEDGPEWMEDLALANAKAHLIEFIKTLDPRDRVAIYGLSETLHVVCDFTSDRDRLLTILKTYDTTSKTNREAAEPGAYHTPVPGKEFNNSMDAQALEFAAATNERRAMQTMAALQSIASHVANIPGRKNLVWLTANLPFSGSALARILVPAQIVAYPVDARGLLPQAVPTSASDVVASGSELSSVLGLDKSPTQTDQPIGIDTMEKIAEDTGGRAFVNTNDVTSAIRKAVEDSAVNYTLGFYIDPHSADGEFHELKVQVKRAGLTIRYPKGYLAAEDAPTTKDQNWKTVVMAVQSPVESSVIPLQAKVDRVNQPLPSSLRLLCSIDIHNLQLVQTGNLRKGAVSVYVIEQDRSGKVLSQWSKTYDLRLSEKQYAALLKSGMPLVRMYNPRQASQRCEYWSRSRHRRAWQPDYSFVPGKVTKRRIWRRSSEDALKCFVEALWFDRRCATSIWKLTGSLPLLPSFGHECPDLQMASSCVAGLLCTRFVISGNCRRISSFLVLIAVFISL